MVRVVALLCIGVFVDDSDVLCLHWGGGGVSGTLLSHGSVQCCSQPLL